MPPTAFSGTSLKDFEHCGQISGPQLAQFGSKQYSTLCNQLTRECVTSLPAAAFNQLSAVCFAAMANIDALTNAQVAAMDAAAFASRTDFSGLTADACSGIDLKQMAKIGATQYSDACKTLTPACVGAVPASAWSGAAATCVSSLKKEAVGALDADDVAQLPAATMSNFNKVAALNNSACAGFQGKQLEKLGSGIGSNSCVGFAPACFAKIEPKAVASINAQCFRMLDSSVFGSVTSEQLGALDASLFSDVGGKAIGQLGGDTCTGFTANQVRIACCKW